MLLLEYQEEFFCMDLQGNIVSIQLNVCIYAPFIAY